MLLTTTETVPGTQVTKLLGVVTAEAAIAVKQFKFVLNWQAEVKTNLAEAKVRVLEELTAKAEAMGADAVVALRLDCVHAGGPLMVVVNCSGTAVKTL